MPGRTITDLWSQQHVRCIAVQGFVLGKYDLLSEHKFQQKTASVMSGSSVWPYSVHDQLPMLTGRIACE